MIDALRTPTSADAEGVDGRMQLSPSGLTWPRPVWSGAPAQVPEVA